MMLIIRPLIDHPAALAQVADWIDAEWGAFSGRTHADTVARFIEGRDAVLPRTFVALDDGKPVGVASLRVRDSVDWDPHAGPWLCNVYVPPAARGRGIAGQLCRHAGAAAALLGFSALFLASTAGDDSLYYRLGYRRYRTVRHGDEVLHLMKQELNP